MINMSNHELIEFIHNWLGNTRDAELMYNAVKEHEDPFVGSNPCWNQEEESEWLRRTR